jgi:hypothetical protein
MEENMDFNYGKIIGVMMGIECYSGITITGIIDSVKGRNVSILKATFLYPDNCAIQVPWAVVNTSMIEAYYPLKGVTVEIDEINSANYGLTNEQKTSRKSEPAH